MRLRVIGPAPDSLPEGDSGTFHIARLHLNEPEVVMRLDEVGLQPDGLSKGSHNLLWFCALFPKEPAKNVIRFGGIGVLRQRAPQFRDRAIYVRRRSRWRGNVQGSFKLTEAALELFRQHRDAVRVAVLDIVMPGMHGDQLLRELRALQPGLPVVLVSGLIDHRVIGTSAGRHTEFVQKPFHPEELIAAVRRVMGADSAGG